MNTAEKHLRDFNFLGGDPALAVSILDSWTPDDKSAFRFAFIISDWATIRALCKVKFSSEFSLRNVVHYLMDATAPEDGAGVIERRARDRDRRKTTIPNFSPERRIGSRRQASFTANAEASGE